MIDEIDNLPFSSEIHSDWPATVNERFKLFPGNNFSHILIPQVTSNEVNQVIRWRMKI